MSVRIYGEQLPVAYLFLTSKLRLSKISENRTCNEAGVRLALPRGPFNGIVR